jgi:hypothetical protein
MTSLDKHVWMAGALARYQRFDYSDRYQIGCCNGDYCKDKDWNRVLFFFYTEPNGRYQQWNDPVTGLSDSFKKKVKIW